MVSGGTASANAGGWGISDSVGCRLICASSFFAVCAIVGARSDSEICAELWFVDSAVMVFGWFGSAFLSGLQPDLSVF